MDAEKITPEHRRIVADGVTTRRNRDSRQRPKGYASWDAELPSVRIVEQVEEVLAEYREHLPLTVRQIFYRMVGRFDYEKTEKAYRRLQEKLVRARRAGWIAFEDIRDDGASTMGHDHFDSEEGFLAYVHERARTLELNKRADQDYEIRVYCETAGMMPQLHKALRPYSVPVYSCSGYDSLTFKHELAQWFSKTYAWKGKTPVMLHLGDYDPDGESIYEAITEDVIAFLRVDAPGLMYSHDQAELFNRVALTKEQVERHELPTKPPKQSSSRTKNWKGNRTCQLEALPPMRSSARLSEPSLSTWTPASSKRSAKRSLRPGVTSPGSCRRRMGVASHGRRHGPQPDV